MTHTPRRFQPHLPVLEHSGPLSLILDVMRTGHKHFSPYDRMKIYSRYIREIKFKSKKQKQKRFFFSLIGPQIE